MTRLTIAAFWLVLSSAFTHMNAQNILVSDNYSAQDLVQNVLVSSGCANVSNFSVSGGNFGNGQQSYGYFTANGSGFPFANGVVLSTSRAISTQGPNTTTLSEGGTGWAGDPDLNQALNISNTYNATRLEFDFIPLTSKISFDYIFASEEYRGNSPCNYSDGFAFLLKPLGSSAPYENLAVIPGTAIPVKVTTVHPNIPGGCPAQNETYFGSYNGANAPINFNGQTAILKAQATVTPGVTYHIKLVISDEGNPLYDSAIFLGGGSFAIVTDLGPNRLIANNNPICYGDTLVLNAYQNPNDTYQWLKNGSIIAGATSATYTVNSPGTYNVRVGLAGTTCISEGEITIEYTPQPPLNPITLYQCDDTNDGITTFNLTKLSNQILAGNQNTVTFYESLADAQNQTNPIPNPSSYPNNLYTTVYARAANAFGCAYFRQINLAITNQSLTTPNPIAVCDADAIQNGITSFDLNLQVTPQVILGLPAGLLVTYYNSIADAVLENGALPNAFTNTVPYQQTLYALIVNGADCYGIIPITLVVHAFDPTGFEDENVFLCSNGAMQLSVPAGYSSYLWSNGSTSNAIQVTTSGDYNVMVTNTYGCTKTKIFHVAVSGVATITTIAISDFAGDNNSITINYSGDGIYAFSIDGIHFQESPVFSNLTSGAYQIYLKDRNGCGTVVSDMVYILDYPRFFTPNGDGYNDYWTINYLEKYPGSKIYIYDRFGKLLKDFNAQSNGWDGLFEGNQVIADDYWFYLVLNNNRIVKSHFALKR